MPVSVGERKEAARRVAWDRLDLAGVVIGGSSAGKIPNFAGADRAADLLAGLDAWKRAGAIKAVPDKAQLPVRANALRQGKTVYMAVPKLAAKHPFYRLAPADLTVSPEVAASSRAAATHAQPVDVTDLERIDLIVCGSVAVDRRGARLGKGAGYSDIEVALLAEAGLIGPHTTIVTTVHPLQVSDEDLPEAEHDFRVDLIVTTDEVIRCSRPRRSPGIVWESLSQEKIAAIPVLAARAQSRG